MDDKTVVAARSDIRPGLAYLFWTSGKSRGGYARLNPEGTTFGTARGADVAMDDEVAAPEQARLRREGEEWFLYDLGGGNTTLVDGQPVYRAALQDKSRVTLGRSAAVFRTLG